MIARFFTRLVAWAGLAYLVVPLVVIIGSSFTAHYRWIDRDSGRIAPTINGRAWVNAESTLLLDPTDPFPGGFIL